MADRPMGCGVIQDLLPLYVDGAAGEESRALVEEHLRSCPVCRRELEQLRGQAEEPKAEWDKMLETFRAREREWAGIREDMAGKLRGLHKDKVRLKRTVDSLESENGKLREALEKWKN